MRCRTSLLLACMLSSAFVLLQLLLHLWLEWIDWTDLLPMPHVVTRIFGLREVNDIVLVWWTPFTGNAGSFLECGHVRCFITQDRKFQHHPKFQMFLFYGSNIEIADLPLPRKIHDVWCLLHEESPKNIPLLSHKEGISLFNHTATFSRFSDVPLTLQYLTSIKSITDQHYLVSLKRKNKLLDHLSPILYIQSDCDTPLDRDKYVQALMKYVPIDSYGACLNNKKLPVSMTNAMESMNSEDFLRFIARYKFTIAFENAVCEDYITEKLWRPLIVGSVPIYLGSPSVQDWLPNPKSAVLASNFSSPKELAAFLLELNANDQDYSEFLSHKKGIITNKYFLSKVKSRLWGLPEDSDYHYISHFECQMCIQAHQYAKGDVDGREAGLNDYNCPMPKSSITGHEDPSNPWLHLWQYGKCEASVLKELIQSGHTFINNTLFQFKVESRLKKNAC